MKLLIGFLTVWAVFAVSVLASNVVELTDKNFDSLILKSGKPALVEFYASWCGHCKNLAPIYEELANSYATKQDKIQFAKIDGDKNRKVGKKYKIQGFPTIMYFDGKGGEPIDYNKGRNLDAFQEFVEEKTGVKANKPKAPPSAVRMLKDVDFPQVALDLDKDVLVAFTASWCGHCKAMAPAYEQVAAIYALEPSVVIAKMDTTDPDSKHTAPTYGVQSYPTIKFFPKGSTQVLSYESGRTVEDFVRFINSHAGTHRTVEGGLDSTAGVNSDFDHAISLLAASVPEGIDKALDTMAKTTLPYGPYYIKVMRKLASKGEGYLSSEIRRLSSILKKGSMAPDRADNFQIRLNILTDMYEKYKIPPRDEL
ncbi:thioredoxin-like protein [Lipomyces oligophaga]|uniref:thioredoxin-like protein n=1 Tax=Lipomyces oligophaga TaxID=45792 RepID=UPI0034CE3A29